MGRGYSVHPWDEVAKLNSHVSFPAYIGGSKSYYEQPLQSQVIGQVVLEDEEHYNVSTKKFKL